MAYVRQFKLRNKTGAEFDMMRKDAFLMNPSGLGWGESISVVPVGNSYYRTDSRIQQSTPSGDMNFAGYAQYEEFLQFCQQGGLILCYMPQTTWRYLRCSIEISKSEISYQNHRLICGVQFTGYSQWYESSVLYRPQQSVDDLAKLYAGEHSGQYAYTYSYEDSTAGGITITNGALSSYWEATFMGYTVNPEWRLYVNNTLVKSGKINATIIAGHRLVIDAIPSEFSIIEYDEDGNVFRDRYGDSDWSTERFFEIPAGESQMVFTDSSQDLPTAYLEVFRRV